MGSHRGAKAARAALEARAAARRQSRDDVAKRIRVVAAGVDTLELHTSAGLRTAAVAQLESLKQQAAATLPGDPLPTVTWAGHVFDVKRGGSKRGSILLEAEAMAISLNPHAPKGLPTGMAEIRSRHLWQDLDTAAQDAEEVLSIVTCGESPDVQVSRVDVTADFQGWVPEPTLLDRFVCRARSDAAYRRNRTHTGWSWGGGGATLARCYDKTREIRGTEKEEWFPKIWSRCRDFDPDLPVWRLEYQVRREAIRELTPIGLDLTGALKSWDGTRQHLGSIFQTLSSRWCVLRLPRSARERQRIDPRWEAIQAGAVFAGCPEPVDLARVQAETEFSRTLDQLSGYLARGMAERWALRGRDDDPWQTCERLFEDVARHLEEKGETLHNKAFELFEPLRLKVLARNAKREQRQRAREEAARLTLH